MELKITPVKYRILAAVVDILISVLAILLILVLTSSTDILNILTQSGDVKVSLINVLGAGLIIEIYLIAYLAVVPLINHGATVGQRLFHMAIVKEDGTEVDFQTLFIRQVLGNSLIIVSTLTWGWVVSLAVMIYRRDNASIADVVGKTYVVDRN